MMIGFMLSVPAGGGMQSKDAEGFVVGDNADYAFACTMISQWEGTCA